MQKKPAALPSTREVAQNIWKLTIPIPFPLHTVNMYALVGTDGWALVDTGMGTPDARAALSAGLQAAGLTIEQLRAIVLTHHHPDHVGLSGELQAQSGAPVYMHPIDIASLHFIWTETMPERFDNVSQFFAQHGLPPTELWYTQISSQARRAIIDVPPATAFIAVEDGQALDLAGESYRVIWTPGHSDGQICLFRTRDGVFLAADHVLPRITPNIGLYSTQDRPDPLGDYLAALRKVAELPASIVLPGHGEPFAELGARTLEISQHHDERIQQLLDILSAGPQHAAALTTQIFGARLTNDETRRMAVAEILSHLEYLRIRPHNRLTRQHNSAGIFLYSIIDPNEQRVETLDHVEE